MVTSTKPEYHALSKEHEPTKHIKIICPTEIHTEIVTGITYGQKFNI